MTSIFFELASSSPIPKEICRNLVIALVSSRQYRIISAVYLWQPFLDFFDYGCRIKDGQGVLLDPMQDSSAGQKLIMENNSEGKKQILLSEGSSKRYTDADAYRQTELTAGVILENVFFKEPYPGFFQMEEGYKISRHKDEILVGCWLSLTLGGIIVAQNERTVQWCDFLWNDEFWELKTLTAPTQNAVSKAVKKGLRQIESASIRTGQFKAAGLVIDISRIEIDFDLLLETINDRITRHTTDDVKIIIVKNGKVLAAKTVNRKS